MSEGSSDPRPPTDPRAKSSSPGFTLLEVLVAVALLGLVVAVLARSAIQGMGYEGDASRRMRASLLADQALWQVEAGLKLGTPPKPGHQESQEGDEYTVSVDVQPLDLAQLGLGAPAGPAPAAPNAPTPPPAASAIPVPLFQVLVRVQWIEGLQQLEVTRSTFAYDATAAAQALSAAAGQPGGEAAGKNPGTGGSGSAGASRIGSGTQPPPGGEEQP